MLDALPSHRREYLAEGLGLGTFMISACVFGTLLGYPGSLAAHVVPDGATRRLLMGLVMGSTAVALIYSPWGRRSGAHLNPATTLTYWRLGKVAGVDAAWYVIAQLAGGIAGVLAASVVLGRPLAHPAVRYVATMPGPSGEVPAFLAEVLITFILMSVVLRASNTPRLAGYTGLLVGALVSFYIAVESPVSGMSMNPARSLASALPAGDAHALWIYFVAPPLGMLLASELYVRRQGLGRVYCAKLNHEGDVPCIFHCRIDRMRAEQPTTTSAAVVARPSA